MQAKIKKHIGYYISLLAIITAGLVLISTNSFDVQARITVIILITFFYIVWGVLHHYIHHDLTAKIMLEYVLIGVLGISVIFFLF